MNGADLAVEARCVACGADNAFAHTYCGACGMFLERRAIDGRQPSKPHRRRYVGPVRLLILGAVTFAVGASAALAAFLLVQVQGASNFAFVLDIARPAINSAFQSVGAGEIQAPDSGSGAPTIVVASLVLASAVAALGACMVAIGSGWAVVRWSPRGRGRRHVTTATGYARRSAVRAGPVVTRALARARWRGRPVSREAPPPYELPDPAAEERRER